MIIASPMKIATAASNKKALEGDETCKRVGFDDRIGVSLFGESHDEVAAIIHGSMTANGAS
jgi:hypothetical protein